MSCQYRFTSPPLQMKASLPPPLPPVIETLEPSINPRALQPSPVDVTWVAHHFLRPFDFFLLPGPPIPFSGTSISASCPLATSAYIRMPEPISTPATTIQKTFAPFAFPMPLLHACSIPSRCCRAGGASGRCGEWSTAHTLRPG